MSDLITKNDSKKPSFLGVMIVFLFLTFAMFAQIFIIDEPYVTHITIIFALLIATVVALRSGYTWKEVEEGDQL